MIVISNAGPLIALARIENFELLREIFGYIHIPQAVYNEVGVKGKGRAGADEVEKAAGDWIVVSSVKETVLVQNFLIKLGLGESETIALALEKKADLVLLDDRKARAIAEFIGLNVSGTVGVLIQAHRQGLIADLKSTLDKLRTEGFWLDDLVYTEALRENP